MARRLHHIEIIPGRNAHTVRHFYVVNEGGTRAYRTVSHVFGNAEDMANHVEDTMAAANVEEERKLSKQGYSPTVLLPKGPTGQPERASENAGRIDKLEDEIETLNGELAQILTTHEAKAGKS